MALLVLLRGRDHPVVEPADLHPGQEHPMPQIDPRGPRFAAGVTSVVLAAVLLSPQAMAVALIALQTALFAVGAGLGVQRTPHAWVFRKFIRPRLGPPAELEDAAPPRFAQAVGLAFTAVALIGFLAGATTLALVATGLALVAALLNAVLGLCLGCEVYLLIKRATSPPVVEVRKRSSA